MATKRKRGDTWTYVVKRVKLLPQPIYLTFKSETEGDGYIARLEKLLDAGVVPKEFSASKEQATALHQVITDYRAEVKIAHSDDKLLDSISTSIGLLKITDITYPWAETWIGQFKSVDRLAPNTIRHYVGALARALDWAMRRGMLATNPLRILPKRYSSYAVKGGREDISRDRRLSTEEETEIIGVLTRNAEPAYLLLFKLALETAMRLREMYTLEKRQVDLKQHTIFLDKTKNGDKRQVPLSTIARDILRAPSAGAGLLFPFWDGAEPLEAVTSRLSSQYQRLFTAANCKGLRFHDLRHEATSRMFERTDLSDVEIAKITGHKDLRVLMRYANLRGSTLAKRLW